MTRNLYSQQVLNFEVTISRFKVDLQKAAKFNTLENLPPNGVYI